MTVPDFCPVCGRSVAADRAKTSILVWRGDVVCSRCEKTILGWVKRHFPNVRFLRRRARKETT
jgi:hypothetical protein